MTANKVVVVNIYIDQVKLIISMDRDTNVHIYGCLLTANKVVVVVNIHFYWCNLLIHVVSIIIVRSV